jgi:hypothetical protein
VPHGTPEKQHEALGYGTEGIRAALRSLGITRPGDAAAGVETADRERPETSVLNAAK